MPSSSRECVQNGILRDSGGLVDYLRIPKQEIVGVLCVSLLYFELSILTARAGQVSVHLGRKKTFQEMGRTLPKRGQRSAVHPSDHPLLPFGGRLFPPFSLQAPE